MSDKVMARAITMSGPSGPVYGPVDLDIEAGGVTVLVCPTGPGRTALLMTLAGRMKPRTGSLSVFGRSDADGIFGCAALAGIDELDELPESVTVADLITEQLRWDAAWYRVVRGAGPAEVDTVCGPVFGDLPLPPPKAYVEELAESDRLLLRIALANTRRPPLLVVGNLDHITSDRHRESVLGRLIALGETQTVVTATVNGVAHDGVRAQVEVPNTSREGLATANRDRQEG
ncbi:hypothetical protein ABQE57_13745 [Mycolicibacterium elephantis]|uniref:hypothetical protein n=1 Tax=Mycolicibacterium elephantis TaxID=81858 RepID=UPI0007EA306B|nr:hypothetical protein [Mycolicibacterium elephantis]OBB24645.1 hypothetical protein A5762_12115 [Mycolicibacterium elephantis]